MKPGDRVILKRKKKRYPAIILSDHTATFPAVTIEVRGDAWIVGIDEILTPEQLKQEQAEAKAKEESTVKDVVDAFKAGHVTFRAIANALGKQMVDVLSRCRKAERMGLIKLNRHQHENKNTTSTSEPVTQVPGM